MWKKEEGASDIVGLEACSSFAIADFYRNLSQFVTDDCSTGEKSNIGSLFSYAIIISYLVLWIIFPTVVLNLRGTKHLSNLLRKRKLSFVR